jgi:hypothetical protein
MKECPSCELVSPDNAERCDCGYDFGGGSARSRSRVRKLAREAVKGVFGVAAVIWLLAPIRGFGLAVFAATTVVILGCGLLLVFLTD